MRHIFLILLLLFSLVLTACSFPTDFVVVNESDHPIRIRYKLGEGSMDPLVESGRPATLEASQLRSREWRELSATQYSFDRANRTVTVSLMPDEALRMTHGGEGEKNTCAEINYLVKAVDISGGAGELILKGDQVSKSFVVEPKPFYSLSHSTICALRYK